MSKQPKTQRSVVEFTSRVHLVPIVLMRRPDFLQKEFKSSRARHIADNFDLNGLGRLVVNHRDDIFWIIDGCHRHHALLENDFGEYDVECEVYENLSDAEMAEVFLLHARRRVMSSFETFNVHCEAGSGRECEIRRVVETSGLKISRSEDAGSVSAVASLGKVYDHSGAVVLGQTVRTIRDAYGADAKAFDRHLIEGLGLVYNRYNGRTNEKDLVQRLATTKSGVRGVLQRAEAQRERTGNLKVPCVAAAIVDIYNRGVKPSSRLPSWWKSADAQ